ncbi:MAG: alpha-galactosidase [Clostridia bacterium]|nr:alpha-galactosidase [Clostridia bacterium]
MSSHSLTTLPTGVPGLTDRTGPGIYPGLRQKQKTLDKYTAMLKDLSTLPVSFVYDGAAYRGLDTKAGGPFTETSRSSAASADGRKISTTVELAFRDGLAVTLEAAIYPDYCAYEWTVYFENRGNQNSALLEQLRCADMVFEGEAPVLKGIYGDGGVNNGCPYEPYELDFSEQKKIHVTPETGRSTYNYFPYFNIQYGDGGTFAAIGWPIMWGATFEKIDAPAGLKFIAGQEHFCAYIAPGERIRTPMAVLLDYEGRDDDIAANLWRHWFIDCNMRKPGGERFEPNISGCTSGMYAEMVGANEANQLAAIRTYLDHGVPLTYWWMDAGWYFEYGDRSLDVWLPTGTWMVDTKRFPTKFRAISEFAAEHGMKTLLWFEPEVVRLEERLRDKQNGIPAKYMLDGMLANMGDPEFVDWMADRVSGIINDGGISLYRQDYGINPAGNFLAQNTEGREGIAENKYAQGYYSYWDKLIRRFPNMMIDSCAAGGGRNDIESMRRAVPLHKTDHDYTNTEDKQSMHLALFAWFPYFGSNLVGGSVDPYILRSNYTPWLNVCLDLNSGALDWGELRTYLHEWTDLYGSIDGGSIYSDYYALTGWSRGKTDWRGWEFYSPETGAGYFQLFRPDNAEAPAYHVCLKGLDAASIYVVRDVDNGEVWHGSGAGDLKRGSGAAPSASGDVIRASGAALMADGFYVELPAHGAGLYVFGVEY